MLYYTLLSSVVLCCAVLCSVPLLSTICGDGLVILYDMGLSHYVALYCTERVVLYSTVLCCKVLCCAVLCSAVLYFAVLCFAVLCYAVLCFQPMCVTHRVLERLILKAIN